MIDHFVWFQMPCMYICRCFTPCYQYIVVHYVIIEIVGWTNPKQYTKVGQLWEYLPIVTLDRYSPRFSEGEILHKGGISMTLGGLRKKVER
jgi:hypothetical protein